MTTDSDMEMEDDITLSCGDQEDNDTTDPLKHKSDVIHGELDVKELIHEAQSSPGWTVPQGVSCQKVSSSLSSELCKKSEGANAVPEQCQLIIVNTPLGSDIDSAGGSEHYLPSERDKSSIPISDVQNTLNDSAAAEVMKSDAISNQNMTVNTPLRLLQDYATENMSEIDHDAFFEDVNAVVVSSSVTTSAKSSQKDAGSHLEIVSQSLGMIDKMSGLQYESRRSKVSSNTKDEVPNTTAIIENHEASQGKDASTAAPIDIVSKRDTTQEGKKTKSSSALPKVDEYGRLVREGSSDSNSDVPRYNKRHRRRGRSRSRSRSCSYSHSRTRIRSHSRSPPDSSRRRRSPRRSPRRRREKRNSSPRNHRSRSRSPTFRRAGEFRDENKRQDRRQIPECFDFRRGKCSRGASCRYMHHEHDRNDSSWRHKSNQKHLEFQPSLNNSRVKDEIEDRSDMNLDNEIKDVATKDDQFIGADKTGCESSKVEAATVQPEHVIQVKLEEIIPQNHDRREFKEVPEQFSSQVMGPKESPLPSLVAASSPYPSQLPLPPPPPPPSLSQGTSVGHVPQLHTDYNQYPVQSIHTGVSHSYQGPLYNQHAQFSVSQDSSWTSLPPPPPRPSFDPSLNAGSAVQGASSQFQQNLLAPRSDFGSQSSARPYGSNPHSKSEFLPQMYPTLAKLPHPPPNRENFGSGNPSNQPGGTGLMRHDHFTHNPLQNVSSSQSFAHGYTHPQPAPQNFSGDNFPVHPHMQNQQPSYGVQYSAGDSSFGVPGKTGIQYPVGGSILGLPGKDGPIIDKSQFPQTDFGGSGIQNHTPYAATFEQALNSQFSSNILPQDNNAPGVNMSDTVVRIPVDEQGLGSAGSKQTTSPPSSARAVDQLLPKSNTEQYDPLFDSIEPSTNPLNRNDHSQKHIPTSDSNMMVRLSGACEPLDVEENYKRTEFGHFPSATSLDYDGYGETADAEVGFVEDKSYSYDGVPNMATGEIENDQVKSAGKSNKYNDSRSTRHFKSAVADFVKDLLKPSWRQGNMSKEAFKTIVRKTVDKVSGAMKSHQIPKSEAKINHYIESSQRKLTKLVMGYVDKYVKV